MKIYTKEWYEDENTDEEPICNSEYSSFLIDDEALTIHDAIVLSDDIFNLQGDRLELVLNNSNSLSLYDKIVFTDYIVVENSQISKNFCIAEELYHYTDGRYEFHILTENYLNETRELNYFTVNCKSIEFIGNEFHLAYK